jgi:dihydrofolate reductase
VQDHSSAARGSVNVCAWIMGRNMFGPIKMHLAIAPVLLGAGEHLFSRIDIPRRGYRCTEHVPTENVTHVVLTKKPS